MHLVDVSVIIPAFNEEKEIESCVRHIRIAVKESNLKCEVIVVDNDSTDSTSEILKRLKVKSKFLSKSSCNTIACVRNAGAQSASGKILLFVDADTWIPSSLIREFYEKFNKDKQIACVGCKVMPRSSKLYWKAFFKFLNRIVWLSIKTSVPAVAGNAVAYRAEAFKKLGGFDERMVASEDQDLCMRCSKIGKVTYMRNVVALTSARRLEKLGFLGLIRNWSETTLNLILKKKQEKYLLTR